MTSDMLSEEYKTITLEQIRVGVQQAMSGHMLAHMKLDIREEYLSNMIVASLTTWAMKESLKKETFEFTYKKPKNSWQMFKREWFPKWLLKGFPIEYEIIKKTVTFDAYEVYPQFSQVTDAGHHFTEIQVRT